MTSKNINDKVCGNNDFWVRKLKKDFDVDFFENNPELPPASTLLRDEYIKTLPARTQYLMYNNYMKRYSTLNSLLLAGLGLDRMDLVKIALFRGAKYDLEIVDKAIIKQNMAALKLCMEKWINSKDSAVLMTNEFLRVVKYEHRVFRDDVYVMILYDIVLPITSKYIKSKMYWKAVLAKLNEFKDISPAFQDIYNKWIDFYTELAK
jgi:hypothetical protein